jgi:hypothetical protein
MEQDGQEVEVDVDVSSERDEHTEGRSDFCVSGGAEGAALSGWHGGGSVFSP